MIPLTILRLLVNGRPFLPSLDGRSGSTTAHCSSVKASNRVNSLTWPVSGKPNSTYRRHALAGDRIIEVAAGDVGGQVFAAGLVDEVRMDVAPVVFGSGKRYFGAVDAPQLLDGPDVAIQGNRVLHLRYQVR